MQLMGNIQVRNVPKKVHAALVRQAEAAGMSLNSYLLNEFERLARRNRNAEILKRAHERPGKRPTSEQIVRVIREIRDA
jgi:hypothetical protein